MLENKLQNNGEHFYKFADVTVRVYVPRSEVERVMEEGYEDVDGLKKCETEEEAFDYLANDEITKMFRSDADVKWYETNLH